jgi:photosystem II stability/assembly factor-like uncharacterized protein
MQRTTTNMISRKFSKLILIITLAVTINNLKAQTWVIMDSSFNNSLNFIEFYDDNTGYLSRGYGIHKTVNGAVSWGAWVDFWPYPEFTTMEYYNSNEILMGASNGKIYRSTDAGSTWNATITMNSFVHDIDFFGSAGVAVDDYCRVAYTTNGGASWTMYPTSLTGASGALYCVDMASATVAYTGGGDGSVHKTTDGGLSWTTQSALGITIYDISFVDANTGYVVGDASGSNGKLFKTTDGGTTWNDISSNVGIGSIQAFIAISPSLLFIGLDHKIYKSTDAGATWTLDFTHPTSSTTDVGQFCFAGSTCYAMYGGGGSHKKIAKIGNISVIGIEENNLEDLVSVGPIPSNDFISVNTSAEIVQPLISITDLTGKTVYNEQLGGNNIQINVKNYSKGMYILQLKTEKGTAYKKIIVD